MRLRDKVEENSPYSIYSGYGGGVKNCPRDYGFLNGQNQLCSEKISTSEARCTQCWNQEFKEEEKVMTKSDLRTGMRVETNENGRNLYIVLKDCKTYSIDKSELIFCQGKDYLSGDKYSDELTQADKQFTIKRIFDIPSMDNLLDISQKGKLLWERKAESKKMTVSEIIKELGYEIEIVK